VTEIREPNYSVDLPGEWEKAESLEPGTYVYREAGGRDTLSVTLLGVKPSFVIADKKMLLEQYMHHRGQFERGKAGTLQQTPAHTREVGDGVEGGWEAADATDGRKIAHRVIVTGPLLADFRYTAFDLDDATFRLRADGILGSAGASA
jgi:hypothetical protein